MPFIKAILLDMDDTLIDDKASYALSIRRLCDDFAFDHERLDTAYSAFSPRFWGACDLAAERELLWHRALGACGYDASLAAAVRDRYLELRVETSTALDGTAEAMATLCSRYRLAVVTNGGGDIQTQRLAHAGLDGYFDAVVCSSDVDAGKPDARIFLHAMQRLGVSPEDTWVVGDSPESDVAGALAARTKAVWYNPQRHSARLGQPRHHHEIARLLELPDVLDVYGAIRS